MEDKAIIQSTVTRAYLADRISKRCKVPLSIAHNDINTVLETITLELQAKKKVKIHLFGAFTTIYKKERLGRNPKTLISHNIISRWCIKWRCTPSLKGRIRFAFKSINTSE